MWKIKHIFDGDYGCEALLPGEEPKLSVTLVNEVSEQKIVSVSDNWLTSKGLDVGSIWPDADKLDTDIDKHYNFWGWQQADVKAITDEYKGIRTAIDLYNALSDIWCANTCAPRMRDRWTKENMTLGQCSITAFLVQDIFGGEVYGILRPGGNYHCFNVVGNHRFDLTSEQFTQKDNYEELDYNACSLQSREVHFAKEEKRLRYEYLKSALKRYEN